MAVRSIFLTLTRNCRGQRNVFRSLSSSSASSSEVLLEESHISKEKDQIDENGRDDDLKSRVFRLRLPKRSATTVLQNWVAEGHKITFSDLRRISRELRNSRRYKHALEISEWMVGHDEFELLDSDYAVRIDLMTKVFGIDAAERYFEDLPPTAKTCETYTSLLHSYAGAKLIDKAEELYERAKEADLSLSALTYNEIMTLYVSVGQVEKVPFVIEDLKRLKVAPDLFTYNLWISSCAATMDIDRVSSILDEMARDSGANEGWVRYMNLVKIYITSGRLVNAESNYFPVQSETGITQREWITYDFLIILYTGLANKDRLDQIWKSLRLTKQKMISRNYGCILSSYLMLGHLREAGEVIDQWKQSAATHFDISHACSRLLKAFTDAGLMETGKTFRQLLTEKGCNIV